jgi:uncharacterized membrane protein
VATERGLDRLITFLDAVVAIAITLLVLPLVDILADAPPGAELADVLAADAAQFWSFLLGFAVIAHLWLAHHRLIERVGGYDPAFVAVNLGWILTVVLLPFATQVVAVYKADRLAVAVYIGTMAVSSACLTALSVLVWHRAPLRRPETSPAPPVAAMVTTAIILVALVLGVLFPAVNYWGLLLLFLTGAFERRLTGRSARAAG